LYNLHTPTELADVVWESMPVAVLSLVGSVIPLSDRAKALEDGLLKRGFQIAVMNYPEAIYNRGGGLYIDQGACSLIVDGKIAIKAGVQIASYTSRGLAFADGSSLDADTIVFATGYDLQAMRDTVRALVGDEIGAKLKQPWGLDEEGHPIGAFRDSGHPRIWYCCGEFETARYYTKIVALQIKATELGILDRSPIPMA